MSHNIRLFAPAKINLTLVVTGKRPDGYHVLDSLVAFADFGDVIEMSEASNFSFSVSGPFSSMFASEEADPSSSSENIAVRAVYALAAAKRRPPNVSLHLIKNLPLASGLGGGSADAAAVVRGLQKLWGISADAAYLPELLKNLGADVPVCWLCSPQRVRGIGDILEDAPRFPALSVVLVNPLKPCPTADVFRRHQGFHKALPFMPAAFETVHEFVEFLGAQGNDLLPAALQVVPEIGACLEALSEQTGCFLSRLSGSGATCFGVFEDRLQSQDAAKRLARLFPAWWVQACVVG